MNPSWAEFARTLLRGRVPGVLHVDGQVEPWAVCHATDCAGQPMLLVRDDDPLAGVLARPFPRAMLRVDDVAPVADAPTLGQAVVEGRVTAVPDRDTRAAALEFAEARPVDDLFDLGAGTSLYRLDLDRVRVQYRYGGGDVDVDDYIAADPDPLHEEERDLLLDLLDHHGPQIEPFFHDVLSSAGVATPGPPRPVRLDRYGFLVDVGHADGRLVRVNFGRPVRDRHDLAHVLHPVLFH